MKVSKKTKRVRGSRNRRVGTRGTRGKYRISYRKGRYRKK